MPTKQNPIPKVIALILVSVGAAFIAMHIHDSTLARLDSMSATEYFQHQREVTHPHSFLFHFLLVLMMGGFYVGVVEFIAYLVGLLFKKPDA